MEQMLSQMNIFLLNIVMIDVFSHKIQIYFELLVLVTRNCK